MLLFTRACVPAETAVQRTEGTIVKLYGTPLLGGGRVLFFFSWLVEAADLQTEPPIASGEHGKRQGSHGSSGKRVPELETHGCAEGLRTHACSWPSLLLDSLRLQQRWSPAQTHLEGQGGRRERARQRLVRGAAGARAPV